MSDVFTISNSKANTWRRCPKQYEYKYVQKLRRTFHGLPLKRGDWLHQCLMVHYDGHDWRERHEILKADFDKLLYEEKEQYGDLPAECSRILRNYLRYYKELDKGFKVIDSEVDELMELPNGDMFRFIIDLIIEENDGGIWLVDHKTVKTFAPESFMLLDSQLARYFWAARKMGYSPLRGVMFNEICTKPPTVPRLLKNGKLSTASKMWCDAYTYAEAVKANDLDMKDYMPFIKQLAGRHDKWFRRTRLPRDEPMMKRLMMELMWTNREIKQAEGLAEFPRSSSKNCLHDCDFMDLCILELQGGEAQDIIDMNYEVSKREDTPTAWVTK